MRRTMGLTLITLGLFAACGGGSESTSLPTVLPVATATATVPATAVSSTATPGSTVPAVASSTPVPSPSLAAFTATNAPAGNTPAPTQAPAPVPTATAPAPAGNPLSAVIAATGSDVRFSWSPSNVTIAPGGTATWTWTDPVQPHNVMGTDFVFGPTLIAKEATVSYTFTAAGVYRYRCEIHPLDMRGTVTVQ